MKVTPQPLLKFSSHLYELSDAYNRLLYTALLKPEEKERKAAGNQPDRNELRNHSSRIRRTGVTHQVQPPPIYKGVGCIFLQKHWLNFSISIA